MPGYAVFLSYANPDREVAEKLHDLFEKSRLSCWMASRDERYGDEWPAVISQALQRSRAVVVLLSKAANESNYVKLELQGALDLGLRIITVRLQDVQFDASMPPKLRTRQWLDAWNKPWETWSEDLQRAVRQARGRTFRSLLWLTIAGLAMTVLARIGFNLLIPDMPSLAGWPFTLFWVFFVLLGWLVTRGWRWLRGYRLLWPSRDVSAPRIAI